MKHLLLLFPIAFAAFSFGQEELTPLSSNPSLYTNKQFQSRASGGTSIDSTFTYTFTSLQLTDVWDDFSANKFVNYPPTYTGANVTSQLYYCLMNSTNTIPEPAAIAYCDGDSVYHDTISVVAGLVTSVKTLFTTAHSIWINNLDALPLEGELINLYDECYATIDSIIDGVPDPSQDTLWRTPNYLQDSARVFAADMNDPSKIWINRNACHNYRYAIDPWSLGVATFDGVDSTGMPYEFGDDNAYGDADFLTSKPIDLFGTSNIFFQFLYQAQGHGNMPEAQDSLIVEFWLVDSLRWYPIWDNTILPAPNQWDTAFIAVPPNFLEDGFKFRIKNKASLSGALDHWHIDYVSLEENLLLVPQNFGDYAISEPIRTLLKDYTSVPWDHYTGLADPNSVMLEEAKLRVYNSDVDATNFGASGTLEIDYNGSNQASLGLPIQPNQTAWDGTWVLGISQYPIPWATQHTFDAAGNDTLATFNMRINARADIGGASASNQHLENDTLYFDQVFKNYYAYDDGSAEVGYGVTGTNSLLAYGFEAYEVDTLTGILMHFVPTVTDVSSFIFLMTVWTDDNGEPGDILYQDDYFFPHYPEYGGAKNEFRYYEFVNPAYPSEIVVPQKFHVGWEQIESQTLNIGMDRNIDNGMHIQYNVNGTWVTSSQEGSLMIRPVFSTGINHTLSFREDLDSTIEMYPNPTTNEVNFNGLKGKYTISVYDMSGREVAQEGDLPSVTVAHLQNGVYLVNIIDFNGETVFTEKLIKQ
jgi:hypothetical protein